MKKFVMKSLLFCLTMLTLLSCITAFILFGIPQQFGISYQHALSLQYDAMRRISSPKVVVMGDSSVPFSLNTSLMEKMLKMPVQTLGIHSGTGIEYILKLSETSVHKGDIMVVELEPSNDEAFTPSIVLTACENNFSMYQAFSSKDWKKVISYYPSYLIKKVKYSFHIEDQQSPAYCVNSFDQDGNYDYYLGKCILPKSLNQFKDKTEFNKNDYTDEYISFLNKYVDFCRERGATVLITFPPFLNESLSSTQGSISNLQNDLSHRLKAPIITKINDRSLPRHYIYNNVSHCNTAGARKVTIDLANDIKRYMHGNNSMRASSPKMEKAPRMVKLASVISWPQAVS